jgi:glycosyltransferase involved in cell wall biosynthesis
MMSKQNLYARENGTLKVVIDARTATDHFPGIGRYVVSLSQALLQVAPELPLSLLHDPETATTRLALPDLPRTACAASPFSLRQQWLVPRHLRQVEAALYHSAYYLMPYWPGVPTILTCYDLIPLIYPQHYTPWQRLFFRLGYGLALQSARHLLAISEATKADLVRHLGVRPERISVTPLAANVHFQPQTSDRITAVRHKYALPEQYVLYVGSNKPHKNLLRLVQAYAHCQRQRPATKIPLVVAGPWDPRYPEAKIEAQQLGISAQIHFLGAVADGDLPALYSGATLFVFPSLYEGFGLPVLEAMACGLPVACANVSSLPEVAGQAALLFQPDNTQAISTAITDLLSDVERRHALARQGLRRAAEFSWQRTAVLTLEVYEMIVGQGVMSNR